MGSTNSIELKYFLRDLTSWCDLTLMQNMGFNPYIEWRSLFQELQGAPLRDYEDFEEQFAFENAEWIPYWTPNFYDVWGGKSVLFKAENPKGETSSDGGVYIEEKYDGEMEGPAYLGRKSRRRRDRKAQTQSKRKS